MKILCLGDSPFVKTGFGVVNRVAVDALLAAGHELVVLGGQDTTERPDEPFIFVPTDGLTADMLGVTKADAVIEQYRPDAVHIIGDPATVTAWMVWNNIRDFPIVAYMPIEGEPMNVRWTRTLKSVPKLKVITCSNYGVRVLASEGIDAKMAYHGVSSDFKEYDPDIRAAMRDAVGWTDKFVVMCVAQNVGRKQWPRLFESVKLIRDPNVILYAHTVPFNNFWLDGWDLPQLAEHLGVADRIFFPASHTGHNDSVPLVGKTEPGLVDLYNMADCFVLPSRVEGFGLPLAEAMACGLPVAHTDYGAGAEVIGSAGIHLPVLDWEYNRSHSRYANVSPRDIAASITKMRNPEVNRQMRRKSVERAKAFTWDSYTTTLVGEFDGLDKSLQDAHQIQEQEEHPDARAESEEVA